MVGPCLTVRLRLRLRLRLRFGSGLKPSKMAFVMVRESWL
jgi:hypothetical protein